MVAMLLSWLLMHQPYMDMRRNGFSEIHQVHFR